MTEDNHLDEIIKNSAVKVQKGRYAVLRLNSLPENSDWWFLMKDDDEISAVVREEAIDAFDYEDSQKWFRLIEIVVSVPFFAVGFIASVTTAIARQGQNVLVVSTFSKDNFLVRDESLHSVVYALTTLGFEISQ